MRAGEFTKPPIVRTGSRKKCNKPPHGVLSHRDAARSPDPATIALVATPGALRRDTTSRAAAWRIVIGAVQRISARLAASTMARGAMLALIIKVGGSFLNIAMLTIAARTMAPLEFCMFAIWFNVICFLSVIALCGQETLIVRSWSEYIQQRRHDLARGALTFGIIVCLMASTLLAAGVAAVNAVMGWRTSSALIIAVCLFLVAQTLLLFIANAARTIIGFVFGEGMRETWRGVVVVGALAMLLLSVPVTSTAFFF